jgi:cell division inhibitor SulA
MIRKRLVIIGLSLTLMGAGSATWGVWLSPDQALDRGVSRLSGDTREQDLQLPAVQNLLEQSRFALLGFILIGAGTVLQIIGEALRPK